MIPNNHLFVDTGINTGWAFFTGTIYPKTGSIITPVVVRKTKENYIRFCGLEFKLVLEKLCPSHVTLEEPEYWENSFKSRTAAVKGTLFHLAANVYTYADRCAVAGIPFTLLTANKWKHNLSKKATEVRVKLINGETYSNEHILDAVAMGLSKDKRIWNLKGKCK